MNALPVFTRTLIAGGLASATASSLPVATTPSPMIAPRTCAQASEV